MEKKKIIVTASLICIAVCCVIGVVCNSNKNKNSENFTAQVNNAKRNIKEVIKKEGLKKEKASVETENKIVKQVHIQKDDNLIRKADLYNNPSASTMPLSAITLVSELPKNIQTKISKIAENNSIFMIQKNKDKIIIITDNPENIRHSIEFTEITISNGHETKTTLGYNDKIKDSNNDIWEYHQETKQPIRHTKYNADGDMEFVEVWNYDNDNPVKYEMKDSKGNVISMRKETQQGDSDLRVEHLVYDKDGNTKVNVSATYDGADIKRFTYYNADKSAESGSVFSEYSSDGYKTKEILYTSDFKIKNTYTSDYQDGERTDIKVYDVNNKEIQKLEPKES